MVSLTGVKYDVPLEGLGLPVALSSSVLLGLVWISIDWAGLGEELGDQALLLAIVVARVVTVAKFVGSGHYRRRNVSFSSFGQLIEQLGNDGSQPSRELTRHKGMALCRDRGEAELTDGCGDG